MSGEIELLPLRTLTHVVGHDPAGLAGRQEVASGFRVLAQSSVAVATPADTTEDVLATITIPAGAMGPNGRLRITMLWSATNNANVKTGRVRLGGIGGAVFGAESLASLSSLMAQRQIGNRNSAASQIGGQAGASGGWSGSGVGFSTATVNTASETTLVITGQKATSGDTLTLESYLVELFYQA